MEKKDHPWKNQSGILIRQVTKFSGDRLHIEIPSRSRNNFKSGDYVEVKKHTS